jgi:hypothetical protein
VIRPSPCPLQEVCLGSLEPGPSAAVVIHNLCRKLCQSSPTFHNPDRISISQRRLVPSRSRACHGPANFNNLVRLFEASRSLTSISPTGMWDAIRKASKQATPVNCRRLSLFRCGAVISSHRASCAHSLANGGESIESISRLSAGLGRWAPATRWTGVGS